MKSIPKLLFWRFNTRVASLALASLSLVQAQAAEYPTTVLADNPLAYYRLEETSDLNAADSSAAGLFPGMYVTSGSFPVLGQPGISTNSITVSAAQTASVTAGYYSEFNQQAPFSFEIWARPTSQPSGGDYRCPIGNFSGWGASTVSGWYIYQTPDSPSAFAMVTPSGIWISYPNYALFNWYHLVGTYDGTAMRFYVNGVLVGSQNAGGYVPNVSNALALGQRGDGYGHFDGNLDEAAYYTHVLSEAQILNHYQVGTNSFRVADLPPSILTDAVSTTNYAGHVAQFSVLADGTAPLSYQWYKGTTAIAPIPGATRNVLTFTCAPEDNGMSYRVVVTNTVNAVTSSVVTLTVSTNLQIVAPLTSITRNVGSTAAFEIVADGALPITYQWKNADSTPVPGATKQTLWLANLQQTDDGATYYVTVSNPYTSVDSETATLTVQSRSVTVPINRYAKVVVVDGPVAYWRLNETAGATTAVDAVGSFDGTYVPGNGSFTFGSPTGVPRETDSALALTGGATVSIPYAIEINSPEAFSVEGWFQPASVSANGNDYRTAISSMSNPYGIGPTGWLVYQTGGNNWSWWPYNGYWSGVQLTDPAPIVAGTWYHLVLTFDGTTFTLYVNGVAKASGTDSAFVQNGNVPNGGAADYNYNYNTTTGLPQGSGPLTLGWRNPVDFNPFLGAMDEVAIYNKALTPQQVQNHYANSTHASIQRTGTSVIVTWPIGDLQAAPAVTGVYTNVPGATSPYTNNINGAQLLYRVQLQ